MAADNDTESVQKSAGTETEEMEWTTEDFTYVKYSKLLYGCDYSREITVSGLAISGFSESGEAKFAKNKDLVIPALDPNGDMIVGVAQSAFEKRGVTSVEFPTGMMVDYEDNLTYKVTKRGNFVIAENAFAGNELTSLVLPEGVIACLPNAFDMNRIETVKFPKTIWWIENLAFARNRITTVDFPTTCDFQLEMHGMAFAKNFIKSVRLPDYTEVVNKHIFVWNTGKEALASDADEALKTYEHEGQTYEAGVVYLYTDNAELIGKDRIHHTEKSTESQKSYAQKLVVNDGTEATKNPDLPWGIEDFTVEGTVITGLSASGIAKRAANKHLVIPDMNANWQYITEIATAEPGGCGLFATETEKFDTVYLPSQLKKVGDYAFQNSGLRDITFAPRMTTIGTAAFQMNELTSVILPDTITSLGNGVFASNPKLERINLSKGLTTISAGAFGCSDGKNWMTNLTSIRLHEGITSIEQNAFAGNNFSEIVFPSTVKTIGKFAFSTKNYLTTPCAVTLNEGLESIPEHAFRNKCISAITIPTTVTQIHEDAFRKQYSDDTEVIVTKLYLPLEKQYGDTVNFPESKYHKKYLMDVRVWVPEDFTYGEQTFEIHPINEEDKKLSVKAWVVTGLTEEGTMKIDINHDVAIPALDTNGKRVQGVGNNALSNKGICSLTLPTGIKAVFDDATWTTTGAGVTERGDFFIGSNVFSNNQLEKLTLPEGVIYVGANAFESNHLSVVKMPQTLMKVSENAFKQNAISTLEFAAETDFALQVDEQAFAMNRVKVVQLPANTEKLHARAFLQNTGMEQITEGSDEEKQGGLVKVYINAEKVKTDVAHKGAGTSVVQDVILGEAPSALSPWGVDDFTYDEAGTTITGLSDKGKMKIQVNSALVLPEKGPSGIPITALGEGKYGQGIFVYSDTQNYNPSSVVLPDSLTRIGKLAFALNASSAYVAEMNSITLPEGLVEIGETAFQNSGLESVSIPDSVTTMGEGAFAGSSKLTSVKLSKNVVHIPKAAFNAGSSVNMKLETVVIPEGVQSIGDYAFSGTHLESLVLPSTLTSIGASAFWNHQLNKVTIPENVTSIGEYAFRITQETLTEGLTEVVLNEGLLIIGKEAFSGNELTEIELPSTVVLSAINDSEDCLFGNARKPAGKIVAVKVSDKKKVDSFNSAYANKYSHIVVYDNLVGTGWKSSDFTYDEEKAALTGWSETGHAKRLTLKILILPEYTPGGRAITSIGEQAFMIPNDEVVVTKFGIDSPNGMTSVKIPATVTKVEKQAFAQNALSLVDLSKLTVIGERAFYGNNLAKAELPDTVVSLGEGAFATNDITELRLSRNVTVIPQGAFSMNIRMEYVEIPDTVTEICATAFAGARLTSLEIPKSVKKIGEKAFHLHHLTELTIPGNVKELGDSAFEGTFKATTLSTLTIEEGVEVIGKYAFKEALIETVHFPNSIKTVGEKPFLNNKGKDGSGVVEVTTENAAHKEFTDDTYVIKYIGEEKPEPKPAGQWKLDYHGWWYQNADGSYPVNAWKDIDGVWYYFNGSGYMVTGWQFVGGIWYYFHGSGAMATGWQSIGGTWYYFAGSGAMATGWQFIGGTWYYFAGGGAMVTGWQSIGGTWYYFAGSGAMVTGWQSIGGIWYYFHGSGAMATNQWIGNYYLQGDGAMATNKWIGPYYVGANGGWIP